MTNPNWLAYVKKEMGDNTKSVTLDELKELLATKTIQRFTFTAFNKYVHRFASDEAIENIVADCKEYCPHNRQLFNVWCDNELVVVTPDDDDYIINTFED